MTVPNFPFQPRFGASSSAGQPRSAGGGETCTFVLNELRIFRCRVLPSPFVLPCVYSHHCSHWSHWSSPLVLGCSHVYHSHKRLSYAILRSAYLIISSDSRAGAAPAPDMFCVMVTGDDDRVSPLTAPSDSAAAGPGESGNPATRTGRKRYSPPENRIGQHSFWHGRRDTRAAYDVVRMM